MAVSPDEFRAALSAYATGVTVVTAIGPDGPSGATANAVSSLSLEPPLMLACLDRGSRTLAVVRDAGRFGISVLAADQGDLARAFASKASHAEKFSEVAFSERSGVPILAGTVAWAACSLRALHDGGDHEIAIGDVVELGADGGDPLVFHGGGYRGLG